MPDTGSDYTIGELARLTQDAMVRMERLAGRLEQGQFVSSEVFRVYREGIDNRLTVLGEKVEARAHASTLDELKREVESLKSDRQWLVRLIILFIVTAALAALFAASGGVPN